MKQQDLLILLKKMTTDGRALSCRKLACSLRMSPSSVSESLRRSREAQLLDRRMKKVNVLALQEFLEHGVKYVFPVKVGRVVRGMPTYVSAAPVKELVTNNGEVFVWHSASGTARGQQIEPLYHTVPEIVNQDEELYQLLVIVDTLRAGKAREKEIAVKELYKRLKAYGEE